MLHVPVTAHGVRLPRWLVVILVGLLSISLCFGTEIPARAEPTEPASPGPLDPTPTVPVSPAPADPTPLEPVSPDPLDPTPTEPASPGPLDPTPTVPVSPAPADPTPSDAPSPQPSEQPALPPDLDSDGDGTPDRPDAVSARVTAVALGVPVEDLSGRSETLRVLANPDGTVTQEAYSAPMWVQGDEGLWVDVDYTLVPRKGGGWEPKAAPSSVVIGAREDGEFARLTLPGGGETVWSWPEPLPEPELDGPTAVFEVADGVDLVVTATALGVNTRIQINHAGAVLPEFTVGVKNSDLQLEQTDEGQLLFTDGGEQAGQTSSLVAWDGRLDQFGDPLEVVPIEAEVVTRAGRGGEGGQALTLTTPQELVDDPEVMYPIVIDPDLTPLVASQDTWVRNGTTTIDTLSYRLLVGPIQEHSNHNPAYAFAQWPTGQISGKKILSASVNLFQYGAKSCSSRKMSIHPLAGSWKASSTTYANKPYGPTDTGTSSTMTQNVGGDGCAPNGFVSATLTKMVQAWADGPSNGGLANYGIQMNVPKDHNDDFTYERRFCSINFDPSHTSCNRASRAPYLSVTYNSAPQAAATPTVASSRVFGSAMWTSATKPVFTTSATDAEASKVKYTVEVKAAASEAAAVVSTCTTPLGTAGVAQSCTPATALVSGQSYYARARATDELGLVGAWSGWLAFGVDAATPATPGVSCAGYPDQSWHHQRPAATTICTFTAASAADFRWWLYSGGTWAEQPVVTVSGGGKTAPIAIPEVGGYFGVKVVARNRSVLTSAEKAYSFGVGTPTLTLPRADDRSTSTFPLHATGSVNPGSTGTPTARVEWRYPPVSASDAISGWTKAQLVKLKSTGAAWTGAVTKNGQQLFTPELVWSADREENVQIPSLLQVRVVFSYPGAPDQPSPVLRFQLVPHAFGGSYPTQDVGAGTLALFTGEYQVSETDVSVPGYGGNLTMARTHGTLTGDPAGPAGVFGPGWTADFAGQGAGLAGYTVTDNTAQDGTFVLTSPEGESSIYQHSSGTRGERRSGEYVGVGETALLGDRLELLPVGDRPGITHSLVLTELDGTVTEFQRNTGTVWTVARTTEPEQNSTVTFARDPDGLISWVFAPAPAGIACRETLQEPGCRALKFHYSATGAKRLEKIQYVAWDPRPGSDGKPTGDAGMATIDVARYGYDAAGRLVETWRPESTGDDGANRKTTYTYTTIAGKTVVAGIADPGQKQWRFGYEQGVLTTVKRQQDEAVGDGDATWTIHYDVPLSGSGLPNLQMSEVARWGQLATDAPVGATAVFEPDHVPADPTAPGDWEYATISYFTNTGRSTNTAVFGAGEWLIDSTRYDKYGNSIWTLSAEGRALALAETGSATAADKYATHAVYNEAGTRVEASYGPMRQVVLENGTTVLGRSMVETDYDDETTNAPKPGRPADAPEEGFMLPVEQRTAVTDKTSPTAPGSTWDVKKVRYRYDPVVSGDPSGWDLRVPTRTLTQDGSGWATTITRYDGDGRVVETRSPGGTEITDGSASDVYSIKTSYYTHDGSAAVSQCRDKPQWTGEVCRVATAGNPSSGYPVPATATTGYSLRGGVTRVEETSDGWTRATVTTRDYLDRETARSVSLTDHTTLTGTTSYDPVTGAVAASTGNRVTEAFTYDSWGRVLTAADGTGNTATTAYDTAGRVKTFDDGKGTYTYTYDGTDAAGKAERRGLTTRIDLGYATGDTDVVTGAYDRSGSLIRQNMPDGYQMTWNRNLAGQATTLSYTKDGAPVVSFTQIYDHLGRVRAAFGPAGARTYRYDDRARLVQVDDQQNTTGCATRKYIFTGDSNRTKLVHYGPAGDGGCQTSTATMTETYVYDQADRVTGDGYSYDRMGRTLTMPASHTDQVGISGASTLAIGYHANDMVASLEQTVGSDTGTALKKQSFTLDASDRVSQTVKRTNDVALTETLNHYDGGSDSPAWTQTKVRPDGSASSTTTWSRYVSDLTDGFAIEVDNQGMAVLQLANLHGDIVATATLDQAGISQYSETDEYGRQLVAGAGSTPRYGWLGVHQRDAAALGGVLLMGARLYTPSTGRFLSIDPIAGGNDNRYTYPADPVNRMDLDGEFWTLLRRVVLRLFGRILRYDPSKERSRVTGVEQLRLKSIRSLEKQVRTHKAKLKAYRKDPDSFDNKGFLQNAPSKEVRERIIKGRIRHLEHEIRVFEAQIKALKGRR